MSLPRRLSQWIAIALLVVGLGWATHAIAPARLLSVTPGFQDPDQSVEIADLMQQLPLCGVYPDSIYYPALDTLTHRYGIDLSSADGSCDVSQPITRGELAIYLTQVLDLVVERLQN